ncbi:MAG: hypothetical protein DWQ01_03735 [Planctomycetota bacterium]|nr:MAG: hypothetical protein DWQ01_03735 [Planctomycetota bacterium]
MNRWITLLCLLAATTSCMKAPDPSRAGVTEANQAGPGASYEEQETEAGDPFAAMAMPAGWERVTPNLPFAIAQWTIPGDEPGVCTITRVGGSAADNVQRWIGQFQVPDGDPQGASTVSQLEGAAYPTTTVVVEGTFTATRAVGGGPPKEGWVLAGAILEVQGELVTLKALAPAATVETALDDLWEAVKQLRF